MIIEKIIRDYIKDHLGVPVYCERPEQKPNKYIIVTKTASTESDRLTNAHISIQSNAETMYDAMLLNEQVIELLDANDIPDIGCKIEGDYAYTDAATKTYRYQCAYNIYYYR